MKYPLILFAILFAGTGAPSQKGLDLETCYQLAIALHPAQKQYALQEQHTALEAEKLALQQLPALSWNARLVGQSESVEVPFTPPGQDKPIKQPLVNGQTTFDATYLLYDGGMNAAQSRMVEAGAAVNRQSIVVETYKLKSRVNNLFFGILLLDAQDSVLANNRTTLAARSEFLQAGEKQGTVLPGTVTQMKIEILKLDARREELAGMKKALTAVLARLTGLKPEQISNLDPPDIPDSGSPPPVNRPELRYFDLLQSQLSESTAILDARRKPTVSLFAQAGIGYANPLNFFDQTLSPFAIGGLQFRWSFDWNQHQRDREIISVKIKTIENQREQFFYEQDLLDDRYLADKATIEGQIARAREIAALQAELLFISASQLNHGVITVSEYLQQFNTGVETQLNLRLHELTLLQLRADYFTQKGI